MEKKPYPSETQERFIVRFTEDGMRDRIAEAAKAAGRSMNAEIVHRLESSFRSVDVENAASILIENNHLRERLEGRERADSINDWVLTTLAKYLRDAVEQLPEDQRENRFAGVMELANGIIHKNGSDLFKFFIATSLQVDNPALATELESHAEDFAALSEGRAPKLVQAIGRGRRTPVEPNRIAQTVETVKAVVRGKTVDTGIVARAPAGAAKKR